MNPDPPPWFIAMPETDPNLEHERAIERERCAVLAECFNADMMSEDYADASRAIAAAIRELE